MGECKTQKWGSNEIKGMNAFKSAKNWLQRIFCCINLVSDSATFHILLSAQETLFCDSLNAGMKLKHTLTKAIK